MGVGLPGETELSAHGLRFGVVAARFNAAIVDGLLEGALDALRELGVEPGTVRVVRVPGAFEVPLAALLLCERAELDALVALGAVVKGETPHHSHLSAAVIEALGRVALETRVPVACGVLTVDTEAQGRERARRGDAQNRGRLAARTAVEMARLSRELRG